jgi:hypothetical protein
MLVSAERSAVRLDSGFRVTGLQGFRVQFISPRPKAKGEAKPTASSRKAQAASRKPQAASLLRSPMAIPEGAFFTDRPETRPTPLKCPRCRHEDTYAVRWMRRVKKDAIPRGADDRDRALYAKLRDYLVRLEDEVTCSRCRRRFEIPSHQSLIFL